MGALMDGDGYGIRCDYWRNRIAKWRAKYKALGCSDTEIERIIAKRRYRR